MPYYAVAVGRSPGIYTTWDECKEQVDDFQGAWFKKFKSRLEAEKCMNSQDHFKALKRHAFETYAPHMINNNHKQLLPSNQRKAQSNYKNTITTQVAVNDIRKRMEKCIEYFVQTFEELSESLDIMQTQINKYIDINGEWQYPDNRFNLSQVTHLQPNNDKNNSPFAKLLNEYKIAPQASNHLIPKSNNIPNVPPLIEDKDGYIDVYIDGAVSKKEPIESKGGVGVWFNHNHPLNIASALEGRVTCFGAELEAAIKAIQQAAAAGLTKLNIHTDSMDIIRSMTKWINVWKANNWRSADGAPLEYGEGLKKLDKALMNMDDVKWTYTRSHQGNEGNTSADTLAQAGVSLNGLRRFTFYEELSNQDV